MVNSVELTADTYLVCLTHALSTEKEEVMGLLLGEMKNNRIAHICSAYPMTRIDRRPDRVEISPEQLSAAAIEAERLASTLHKNVQVLGWYHSHPHITVWPSHVDVRTQADYQLLDPNFVGLIFSVFSKSENKTSSLQLICFQSISSSSPTSYEHIELSLSIVPRPHCTMSDPCVSAITQIPHILFEEEQLSYKASQRNTTDLLNAVHNGAVYSLSLVHVIQVICEPITQLLAIELERNKETLRTLTQERDRLVSVLKERNIAPEFETEF